VFTSFFNKTAAKALLVMALLAGITTIGSTPAAGQTSGRGQFALSPSAQQTLNFILSQCGMPVYGQRLVLNAVHTLGTQRAEIYLSQGPVVQVMAASPSYLCGQFRIIMQITAELPSEYHQAFVDGYFQVAPALQRFTEQVLQLHIRQGQVGNYLFARGQTIRECMGLLNTIALDRNPNEFIYVSLPPACR
jgi:hypothetical protein